MIITAHQRSYGKVMFSVVSVCLSVHRSHVTITHDALDLTTGTQSLPPVDKGPEDPVLQTWVPLPPPDVEVKLWEGNVFTGVCNSVQGRESHVTITMMHWTSLYMDAQPPPPIPPYLNTGPHCYRDPASDI